MPHHPDRFGQSCRYITAANSGQSPSSRAKSENDRELIDSRAFLAKKKNCGSEKDK